MTHVAPCICLFCHAAVARWPSVVYTLYRCRMSAKVDNAFSPRCGAEKEASHCDVPLLVVDVEGGKEQLVP